MITQLSAEVFLDKQDCLKRLAVDIREDVLEPPSNPLPGDTERVMNLFAVGTLQNHSAGTAYFKFNTQVLQVHHCFEFGQKFSVLHC